MVCSHTGRQQKAENKPSFSKIAGEIYEVHAENVFVFKNDRNQTGVDVNKASHRFEIRKNIRFQIRWKSAML